MAVVPPCKRSPVINPNVPLRVFCSLSVPGFETILADVHVFVFDVKKKIRLI